MSNYVDTRVRYCHIGGIIWKGFSSMYTMGRVKNKRIGFVGLRMRYGIKDGINLGFYFGQMTWVK